MTSEQVKKCLEEFTGKEIEFKPKAGRELAYAAHHAVTMRLIEAFDGDYDFEIVEYKIGDDSVFVLGKLTAGGAVSMAFGGAKIAQKSDIWDVLNSAASRALTKAASRRGIGLHLWINPPGNPNEQRRRDANRERIAESSPIPPIGDTPESRVAHLIAWAGETHGWNEQDVLGFFRKASPIDTLVSDGVLQEVKNAIEARTNRPVPSRRSERDGR